MRQPLPLELLLQRRHEPAVTFDGEDPHTLPSHRERECPTTRSELDDELVAKVKPREQPLDDGRVGQQVLSEGAPPAIGRTLSPAVHGTAP
jgi:hypothetical protein